jgi:HK97 family phage portal protein
MVGFAERRGVWSGPLMSSSPELARLWAAPSTSTGVSVSEMSALTYSVVWACVNNISTDVASLPLILYKTLDNGGKERLKTHKLYRILHDEPNPEMSSMTFRGTVQAHALTWGNGYAEIVRDGAGRVAALWPITPDRVTVLRDTRTGMIVYEVSRLNGGIDRLPATDMLHIPGLGYDGTVGYNLIEKAREAIALGLATERFGGSFFGNGATFGGVISLKEQLTEQAKKSFREQMAAQHQGVDRAHKFLLLGNEATYQKLGVDPDHAQFIGTRENQIEEICRFFRMPPHKVQHLLRSTNNNIEHQGIEYYKDTLRPWCVRWEQEILRKLIAPSERMIQFAKHKIEGVERGDLQSRYAAYAVGRQWGWLSADDICELEDLNPLPNGQGKVYLSPMNMTPSDRLDDIIDKQVAPDPQPVAQTAPKSDEDEADEAARMEAFIKMAIVDVETRIADTTEKIIKAEADKLQWKEFATGFEADAEALRAQLVTEQAEAGRLKALHLEAVERADRLAIEQEAIRTAAAEEAAVLASHIEEAKAETETLKATAAKEMGRLQVEAAEISARAAQLEAEQETLRAARQAADEAVAKLQADLALADTAMADTSRAIVTEHTALEVAQTQLEELQVVIAETKREMERLSAEREAIQVDATTAVAAAEEAQRATTEAAENLTKAIADAEAAGQLLAEETARLTAERAAHTETQAKLKIAQDAEAARVDALLTANRDLVSDTMARLIWKETERARKNKGTPAKLRAWADSFYLLHEETCIDALRPAMRTHLALIGSMQDVDTYTREKIHPHLEAAIEQIRTIAAGDADDFPVALEQLLTRWERERPAAIADLVLREEISYVRSL